MSNVPAGSVPFTRKLYTNICSERLFAHRPFHAVKIHANEKTKTKRCKWKQNVSNAEYSI